MTGTPRLRTMMICLWTWILKRLLKRVRTGVALVAACQSHGRFTVECNATVAVKTVCL